MIQWLYRYVFRGLGVLMIIGMITILYLALMSQRPSSVKQPVPSKAGQRK